MSDGNEHPEEFRGSKGRLETPSPDYAIDRERRFVSVRFAGKLTAAVIEAYTSSLRKDPQFEADYSEIVDLRDVEEIDITPTETIALADAVDPFLSL